LSGGTALSVVVPVKDEAGNVAPLAREIAAALAGREHEILFVDDGSTDGTAAALTALKGEIPQLRVLRHGRNLGQSRSIRSGVQAARGDIIVTLDGDGQNDPADIALLLEQIESGYDVVVGWRHNRQDKLITRKIPSRIANWLIGRVTGVPIRDNGCSLKAFRASLIKRIPLYSEMHRFIPAMASIAGPRVAQIRVRHHARRWGQSKYGLSRIYKVLLDLMVIKTIASFASRPLRWFAILSLPLFALAFFALGQTAVDLLLGADGISLPIAGSGVIFLGSALILLCSGALAELIYARGDVRDREFLRLTQTILAAKRNPEPDRAL